MTENKEDKKNEKWKIWVDVVSAVSVFIFIPTVFWCAQHSECSGNEQTHPVLTVVIVNLIPFIFGVIWLGMRYSPFGGKPILAWTMFMFQLKIAIAFIIINVFILYLR